MKYLYATAFAVLAMPAAAQQVTFDCTFTEACRQFGGNCQPENVDYSYDFDMTTGTGAMIHTGTRYDGEVHRAEGAHHFFLINSAGAEMTSISDGGRIVYVGTLSLGDDLGHYRLTGNCRDTSAGSGGGGGSK